ncbi:MAG: glutamate dehydrogenase, partial [Olleya sp.]
MLNHKQLTLAILILLSANTAFSQLGFSHEVGIITGPVAFKSDFGERFDYETNAGNSGIGIGLVHYINFAYQADCNCYTTDNYFNDHFKLRTEISWNKTKLDHLGQFVDPSQTSADADRLRAHSGEANNFDIGMQLEYFPLSIRSF